MPSIHSSLSRGLSSGLRLFRRQPAFAFTCVAILALGFTFSATLFSTVYSLLLRPLPFEGAERFLDVKLELVGSSGLEQREILPADFSAWRRGMANLDAAAFEVLAAYSMHMGILNGTAGGGAAYVTAEVTADVLAMTGVAPLLGRLIQPADEALGAPRVAVIDAELWRRHFGEERRALGASFELNGEPVTLIGVVPAGFAFPHSQKVWLNLRIDESAQAPLSVIGVLGPGRSTAVAVDQLERMVDDRPAEQTTALRAVLEPLALSQADQRLRNAVTPLLFGVAALLLVACANVTSLLLGRGIERSHEIALRSAIGASRSSIAGAQFGECLVLTMTAAGLGMLLARAGVGLVERLLAPGDLLHTAWMEIRLDPPVVGATLLLALVVAVLSSLLPVWRATRIAVSDVLREGARGYSRRSAAGTLVIVEVALAVAMLAMCGVLLGQVNELRSLEPGFSMEDRTTAKISFHAENEDPTLFFAQLEERLVVHPEIEGVAFTTSLPTQGSFGATWQLETREQEIEARWLTVSPSFFDVAGIELLAGRSFDAGLDRKDAPLTALVNRSFVARFLADETLVLGQRLQPARDDNSRGGGDPPPWLKIIGIVEDTVMGPVDDERGTAAIYLSSTQRPRRAMAMIVSGRDKEPAERLLRTVMAAVDERAVSFDYRSMQSIWAARSWLYDLLAALFVFFAGASLVLTLGGVYGVVVAATRRQRMEYGIRLALGARRQQLLMSVLWTSFLRLAVGIGAGLVLSALSARAFSSFLHQAVPSLSSGWMIWSALGTAALVVTTGLAASLPPAIKTSRIDPVEMLRSL